MCPLAASSLSKTTISLPTNNLLEDRHTEISVEGAEDSRFIYQQILGENIVSWHHQYSTSDPRFVPGGAPHLPSPSSSPLLFYLLSSYSPSLFHSKKFLGKGACAPLPHARSAPTSISTPPIKCSITGGNDKLVLPQKERHMYINRNLKKGNWIFFQIERSKKRTRSSETMFPIVNERVVSYSNGLRL